MIPLRSHIAEPAALAAIAADEFTRRRAQLRRAFEAGQITAEAANANAELWLAIAARTGAQLPELEEESPRPGGGKARLRADQIADAAEYLPELARARDVARTRAEGSTDQRLIQRALDLTALAEALGTPLPAWAPAPSSSGAVGQQGHEREAA